MLKNISNETVNLKWDGVEVSLNPGDVMDVTTSYGAKDKLISSLEDRFINNSQGKIVRYTPDPIVEVKLIIPADGLMKIGTGSAIENEPPTEEPKPVKPVEPLHPKIGEKKHSYKSKRR